MKFTKEFTRCRVANWRDGVKTLEAMEAKYPNFEIYEQRGKTVYRWADYDSEGLMEIPGDLMDSVAAVAGPNAIWNKDYDDDLDSEFWVLIA
jgi:hypothetical protein